MKKLVIFLVAATAGYLCQQSVIQSRAQEMPNNDQVIRISASTFEFQPSEITVKRGVPVVLEVASKDRHHGLKLPAFGLRVDIKPGAVQEVRFVPDKLGQFTFFCDVFCGDGHEDMSGIIRVIE